MAFLYATGHRADIRWGAGKADGCGRGTDKQGDYCEYRAQSHPIILPDSDHARSYYTRPSVIAITARTNFAFEPGERITACLVLISDQCCFAASDDFSSLEGT